MTIEPTESGEYVVIPEFIADLLDGPQPKPATMFFQSAVDDVDDDAALPSQKDIDAITMSEMSYQEAKRQKRLGRLGRTIYPVVEYYPAIMVPDWEIQPSDAAPAGAGGSTGSKAGVPGWDVQVVDRVSGQPIPDVTVTAFSSTTRTNGVSAVTGANGIANLPLPASNSAVHELFVIPKHTHWSRLENNVPTGTAPHVVSLDTYSAITGSALHIIQGPAVQASRGAGVKVGIIDTGVGPHPDIQLAGGSAPISDPKGGYDDKGFNGTFHGTHVAGLIAGKGGQFRGIAPDCEIYSYRVFAPGAKGAKNTDLVAALFRAMQDGCHIVNMSLGSPKSDLLLEKTVRLAMRRGIMVIAASGNDSGATRRAPLHSPAKVTGVVSVSAMGCQNSYPRDSAHVIWECTPCGTAASHFVASFANSGNGLHCIAPGVGLVSTVPGGYSAMDGTSMATPVVSGIAACRISVSPALGMPATATRTTSFKAQLYTATKSLGFAPFLQGKNGLPQ
jgi:subtilisin family serine protease